MRAINVYFFSYRWLEDYARKGNYDVSIENVTDDMSCLGIAGPHSRAVLSKLTSTDMSHSQFKFLTIKDIELAGIPVRAMRISYTGKDTCSLCDVGYVILFFSCQKNKQETNKQTNFTNSRSAKIRK